MSLLLCQNTKRKGIRVKDKGVLLAQFANDTALFLDSSAQAFNEAIWTLIWFVEISGLKMNNDKTKITWKGSMKNSQVRFLRDMNFCWDPGTCKVSVIKFSANTDQINLINYEAKLEEIKTILKSWKKR